MVFPHFPSENCILVVFARLSPLIQFLETMGYKDIMSRWILTSVWSKTREKDVMSRWILTSVWSKNREKDVINISDNKYGR